MDTTQSIEDFIDLVAQVVVNKKSDPVEVRKQLEHLLHTGRERRGLRERSVDNVTYLQYTQPYGHNDPNSGENWYSH